MSIYTQKWINMVLPNIRASLSFFPSSVSPKQSLSNLIHGTKDLWWVMWAYLRLKFTMNILPVALLDPRHWLRGPVRATCLSGRFFFPFCLHSFSLSLYCLSLTQSNLGRKSGCMRSEHTWNTVKCCIGLTNFCHVGQSRKKTKNKTVFLF